MKKILDILDYTYYRLYQFFSSYRIFAGMEELDAINIIVFIYLIPIACVGGTINGYIDAIPTARNPISRYFWSFVIGFVTMVPLMKRYMYNKSITKGNYRIFKERWGKEDPKQRKKRGWLIAAIVINNIVVFPIILAVLEHYHIFD